MTDHGAFVLVNVYGPAISTEDSAEERYAFKLRFYKVVLLSANQKARSSCHERPALRPVVPDHKASADSADANQCLLESDHCVILPLNPSACIGQSCQVDTSQADMLELSMCWSEYPM